MQLSRTLNRFWTYCTGSAMISTTNRRTMERRRKESSWNCGATQRQRPRLRQEAKRRYGTTSTTKPGGS